MLAQGEFFGWSWKGRYAGKITIQLPRTKHIPAPTSGLFSACPGAIIPIGSAELQSHRTGLSTMDASFNPYLKWLGISLQDQPANHYRLLGIPELIDDSDVIDNAASRQMAHVRTFATGKYSQLSQQLLNEIAAAKVCLLSPAKKLAYDEQLRQAAARKAAKSTPTPTAAVNKPVLQTRALPQANAIPASPPAPNISAAESQSVTRRMKKKNSPAMLAAVLLVLLVLAGIAIWRLSRSASDEAVVAGQESVVQRPVERPTVSPAIGNNENKTPVDPAATNKVDVPVKTTEVKTEPSSDTTPEKQSPTKESDNSATSTDVATGQTVDLLKQIDLARDTVDGTWRYDGGVLRSPANRTSARMMLPGTGSKEYVLDMDVERMEGDNLLFVALMVGEKQVEVFFDWHLPGEGSRTGFFPEESFPLHLGPVFEIGRSHNVRCLVTGDRLQIELDGKTILDQRDRLDKLALSSEWEVANKKAMFLGSHRSSFRFTKIELTSLDGSEIVPPTQPDQAGKNENLPVANKQPLPAGPELETAQTSLREIFKDELAAAKTAEQQSALATTFLSQVTGDKQSPAEAYVLLNAAKTMAIKGADVETAMAAVNKLAGQFEIDALKTQAEALTELSKSAKKPAEQMALISAIGRAVRELVEVDRFELAEPLTKLAQSAALQSRNVQLRKELAVSIKEFGELQKAYLAAQPALETLKQSPDDAAANLEVGRYRAFIKADWPRGLKNLAAGSDAALSALAKKDLAGTDNISEQVKIGDAWYDAAKAEAASSQKGPKIHAGHWYGRALPQLTGLSREHVAKRRKEIRELNPVGRINRDDWKIWSWDGSRYQDSQAASLQFESGALSVASQGDSILLVYQPLVGDRPFLATIEVKGEVHHIGLVSSDRINSSIVSSGAGDQEWHTITIERQPDKVVIMTIDGNPTEVSNWQSDNDLVGKVAFWLQPGQACTIRWFEVQTTTEK
jgi:hypothetical protein